MHLWVCESACVCVCGSMGLCGSVCMCVNIRMCLCVFGRVRVVCQDCHDSVSSSPACTCSCECPPSGVGWLNVLPDACRGPGVVQSLHPGQPCICCGLCKASSAADGNAEILLGYSRCGTCFRAQHRYVPFVNFLTLSLSALSS